jgi:allantoin racemase
VVSARRRILVINPNSSTSVTAAIDAPLEPLRLSDGPEILVTHLTDQRPGIISQRDADSAAATLAKFVAGDRADAFVIAGFSDPGLHGTREAPQGRPVMGIGEWGVLLALTFGERFGIVALSSASIYRQQRMVRQRGRDALRWELFD